MQSPPVLAFTTTLPVAQLALLVEDRDQGLVGRAARHVGTIGEAFDDPQQILGRLLPRALSCFGVLGIRRTVATPPARSGGGTLQAVRRTTRES